jgi:hypothetical protein
MRDIHRDAVCANPFMQDFVGIRVVDRFTCRHPRKDTARPLPLFPLPRDVILGANLVASFRASPSMFVFASVTACLGPARLHDADGSTAIVRTSSPLENNLTPPPT